MIVKECRGQKENEEKKYGNTAKWTLTDFDTQLKISHTSLGDYYYHDRNMPKIAVYDFLLNHADKIYKQFIFFQPRIDPMKDDQLGQLQTQDTGYQF